MTLRRNLHHVVVGTARAARLTPLAVLLALCLAAASCSNDSGSDAADTSSAADSADVAAVTAPAPTDQCQNATDLGWLKGDAGKGQTGRDIAREAAGDCGLGCLNHPAPDQCAIKCMVQDKGVQLSAGCAGCYGGIVICTISNCLPKCIDDAQDPICKDCQKAKGCDDAFYGCTGNLD